jgi:hypothetical protein
MPTWLRQPVPILYFASTRVCHRGVSRYSTNSYRAYCQWREPLSCGECARKRLYLVLRKQNVQERGIPLATAEGAGVSQLVAT